MVCRFQCAARLAACSLQRASDNDSDAAIEEKAAIFVHGRDPQAWASAARPIMGALPLSAVSQHLRAGRRGVAARYHPTRCPAPSAPSGIGAGAAYRPCQVPQCHFVALDPPHLRQDQDHSPSRHGPHPARHGYEEGGGVPGVGASSGTAHDFSYISGAPRRPPGALLRLLPYTVDINHPPSSL